MKTQLNLIICLVTTILISCDSYPNKSFSSKEIVFTNDTDGTILSGTLTLPNEKNNVPAVVLIHGSGPMNRDLGFGDQKPFKDIAEYLSDKGIAVLRYDKRGVGKSTGQFTSYDWENFKKDGIAAVQYLKSHRGIDTTKIGAIGLSEGGIIVPMIANLCADISFVVLLGSPGVWGKEIFYNSQLAMTKAAGYNQKEINEMTTAFDKFWTYITKEQLSRKEENEGKQYLKKIWNYIDTESKIDLGLTDERLDFNFKLYRSEKIRKSYNYNPKDAISQLKCPVLALNGDKDVQTVSHVNLTAIKEALENGNCKNYEVLELKNHNHIFQICETGKYSEYKEIKGTMSKESLTMIKDWILKQ